MTTWFGELHNTLVQRCSPLSVSSSQIRRNPRSCHPPHPCPHCHIGSDAGYLPAGKPASPGTTTGNANLRITNLRRRVSPTSPPTGWASGSTLPSITTAVFASHCVLLVLQGKQCFWIIGGDANPRLSPASSMVSTVLGGRMPPPSLLQGQLQIPLT